jgi:hypothetical protein
MAGEKHGRAPALAIFGDRERGWWAWSSNPVAGLPGWVTVLGFRMREGAVDLVHQTVTWVETSMTLEEAEKTWLRQWSDRNPLPSSWDVGGITTRLVRSIQKGELERWARAELQRHAGYLPEGVVQATPGISDVALARLAARYVELSNTGRHPVTRLADERREARNTISHKLFLARNRCLLTSEGAGRAGGVLTTKAMRLLEEGD